MPLPPRYRDHRAPALNEITRYLQAHRHQEEAVFPALAYFDGVNFAAHARATTPYLFRADRQDLPAIHRLCRLQPLRGAKQLKVYRYNDHEGGEGYQAVEKVRFLAGVWG